MALMVNHGFYIPIFGLADVLDTALAPIRLILGLVVGACVISATITWLALLLGVSIVLTILKSLQRPKIFVQNAAVLFLLFLFYMPLILSAVFFVMFFNPFFILSALIYLVFMAYDWNTPRRGGRSSRWFREWSLYNYFRDYFPIRIIKTAGLDPTKNYMFAYHPHGVACLGIRCFIMEAMKFKDLFPGLESCVLTMDGHFKWPVFRDYLMATGFCSVSKESIAYLFSHGTGKALINVIGGVAEVQEAHPGSTTVVLSQRRGFVKMCLQHGASLVPVYAFGETDVLSVINGPEGSFLRNLQRSLRKILGYSPVFSFGSGILPYRKPINVVVGAPIDLPRTPVPSKDQIQQTHEIYMQKLTELFNEHKAQYGYEGSQLNII